MLNKAKRRSLQLGAKTIKHSLEKILVSMNNQKKKDIGAIVSIEIAIKLAEDLYKEISSC